MYFCFWVQQFLNTINTGYCNTAKQDKHSLQKNALLTICKPRTSYSLPKEKLTNQAMFSSVREVLSPRQLKRKWRTFAKRSMSILSHFWYIFEFSGTRRVSKQLQRFGFCMMDIEVGIFESNYTEWATVCTNNVFFLAQTYIVFVARILLGKPQ